MKTRKFIAVLLAVCVLTAVLPASAGAATYSDVVGTDYAWALPYIEDMSTRGLYVGYDGKFNPGDMLTVEQALAVCVRACGYSDEVKAAVLEQYTSALDGIFGTDRSWYRTEFAAAVEAGIVTIEELAALYEDGRLMKSLTREEFTKYLVAAMQMLMPTSGYTLSFVDKATIDKTYEPYIYLLSSVGIIVGDLEGNFLPKNQIRRADSATMFSRAVAYMENNGITPELEDYCDYTVTAGTITAVSQNSNGSATVTLSDSRGSDEIVTVPAAAKVYEHNVYTDRDALESGRYAKVLTDAEGKIYAVRLYSEPLKYSGTITLLSVWGVEIDTGTTKRFFDLDKYSKIVIAASRLDGASQSWIGGTTDQEALMAGFDRAECVVDELGNLAELYLLGGKRTETLLFQSVTGGVVTVTSRDGITHTLPLASGTTITLDGAASTTTNYSALVGKMATFTIDNYTGNALTADIDTKTTYVQAGLSKVTTRTNSNSILVTVNPDTNRETNYTVTNGVKAYYNGQAVALSAIPAESFVTLRLEGGNVAEVIATTGKRTVSGEIVSITYGTTIVLEVNGALKTEKVELNASKLPTITRAGSSSSIDKLRQRDMVDITIKYNRVTTIVAAAPTADHVASLVSIAIDSDGTKVTLLLDDGTYEAYLVSAGASITKDGKAVALSTLSPGTVLAVVVSGSSVTSIEVQSTPATSGELAGTVLFVNNSDRTFLLETANGNVTVSNPISARLINAKGETLSSTALTIGVSVQIMGEYSSDGQFTANLIIVR